LEWVINTNGDKTMATKAQRAIVALIQDLGLSARYDDETGEFRVVYPLPSPLPGGHGSIARLKERQEATAYYTDDGIDALDTAKAMLRQPNPYE
jgi:hypothetical protein